MTQRPQVYPGDWVMLRDRKFPMRVQDIRQCGRGWRVFGEVPKVEINHGGGVHVDAAYRGFNAKDITQVRPQGPMIGSELICAKCGLHNTFCRFDGECINCGFVNVDYSKVGFCPTCGTVFGKGGRHITEEVMEAVIRYGNAREEGDMKRAADIFVDEIRETLIGSSNPVSKGTSGPIPSEAQEKESITRRK